MRWVGTLFAASLAVAVPLAAQRASSRLGVGIGLTAPTGEYHADASGEGFDMGWEGLLFLELKSIGSMLGTRFEVAYSQNGANDQTNASLSDAVGEPVNGSVHLLSGSLDLTLGPHPKRGGRAYLFGGVGLCRATLSAQTGSVTADTTENKFAWNVGAGVTGFISRAAPFAEVRYTHVDPAFGGPSLPFFSFTVGMRL